VQRNDACGILRRSLNRTLDDLADRQHRFMRAPAGSPGFGQVFLAVEQQPDHRVRAAAVHRRAGIAAIGIAVRADRRLLVEAHADVLVVGIAVALAQLVAVDELLELAFAVGGVFLLDRIELRADQQLDRDVLVRRDPEREVHEAVVVHGARLAERITDDIQRIVAAHRRQRQALRRVSGTR
jgi:hypothetical protein